LDNNFHVRVNRCDWQQIALEARYELPDILIQESRFELQARDLFYSYCDINRRGVLEIDTLLLSCQPSRPDDTAITSRPVLCPWPNGRRPTWDYRLLCMAVPRATSCQKATS
jgi:hypothetical protein